MSGALRSHDDGEGGFVPCAFCRRDAAGPCAGCRRSVCGDCCTLTEGGAKVWAICLECDRKKGSSLGRAWRSFGGMLVTILVVLGAAVALMEWLSR